MGLWGGPVLIVERLRVGYRSGFPDTTVDDRNPALPKDLRTRNYGNYGIFLIVGHAGFISSTVAATSLGSLRARIPSHIRV